MYLLRQLWYNIIELKNRDKVCSELTLQQKEIITMVAYYNTRANCAAYAFTQCYDSDIAITFPFESDAEKLQQLKILVKEYIAALHFANVEYLLWTIPQDIIDKVNAAQQLADAY